MDKTGHIGYVSIIIDKPNLHLKSCKLKNATVENLNNIIIYNINTLDKILDYNKKHNIYLYRISSEFIPFASHPINKICWWKKYKNELLQLGNKANKYNIRLSFHPGQYTTLSSPNNDIVKKSIKDLQYHCRILDCMNLNSSHKIILHIGGAYNNKPESIKRFIKNYKKLDKNIKNRLVLENDDKIYNIEDLLYIHEQITAPIIFDYLHHKLNNSGNNNLCNILKQVYSTWKEKDGIPKIHYSQQAINKHLGCHSKTINTHEFLQFYNTLIQPVDIMLEVKDKNISALKCIKAINKI